MCATSRQTVYRPAIACQRATRSEPIRLSSSGTRAIRPTSTAQTYPHSSPAIRPAPVSQPAVPTTDPVSAHQSAVTAAAPAHSTASTGPAGERRAVRGTGGAACRASTVVISRCPFVRRTFVRRTGPLCAVKL